MIRGTWHVTYQVHTILPITIFIARTRCCHQDNRWTLLSHVVDCIAKNDANGNAMLPKKVWISEIPATRFLCTARYEHKSSQKSSHLEKKKKNTHTHIPGQMLGQDRPEKNSSQTFNSKRRDSESSTDIDRQCSQHGRWYVAGAGQASDERHI